MTVSIYTHDIRFEKNKIHSVQARSVVKPEPESEEKNVFV